MSNILAKDRKTPQLKPLITGEKLVADVMKVVNDENKIPKRQRMLVGSRIVDHSFESLENLRAANSINVTNKKLMGIRLSLATSAKNEANKLNTDIRLLPEILSTLDAKNPAKWQVDLQKEAAIYEKEIENWHKGEYARNTEKVERERAEREAKRKKKAELEKKVIPAISFINKEKVIDINDQQYVSGMMNKLSN